MTKEELIELLNTLNFEEVKCMTLSYYKKKPKKNVSYWEETEDYNPKTICIGTDLEKLINKNDEYSRQRDNEIYKELDSIKSMLEVNND